MTENQNHRVTDENKMVKLVTLGKAEVISI